MQVGWDAERRELSLLGRTCGGQDRYSYTPAVLQPGDCRQSWIHLQLEAEERQVTLSQVTDSGKVMGLTLPLCGELPSIVVVSRRARLGYSAANTTTAFQPVPAKQCVDPPCDATTETVCLVLPVLFSLECPFNAWDTPLMLTLHLLDDAGVRRGMVTVDWHEEAQDLVLWGRGLDGQEIREAIPAASLPGPWLHLQLEAEKRKVTLSLLLPIGKVTAMTLSFQTASPSVAKVFPCRRNVHYSATPGLMRVLITSIAQYSLLVMVI